MTDQMQSTLLGAALAVAGGFVGAILDRLYTAYREKVRTRRDLIAAIRLACHEMATLSALIRETFRSSSPPALPLSDPTYRSVQLALAHGLPDELRKEVFAAYGLLPFANARLDEFRSSATPSTPVATMTAVRQNVFRDLQMVEESISKANQHLLDHLSGTMKVSS